MSEINIAVVPKREGPGFKTFRTAVSQAANNRYLRALASVDDTTPLVELASRRGATAASWV
jgi:hypothetical protein